jgi:hypothetical protein
MCYNYLKGVNNMPSKITATLEKINENDSYISFAILGRGMIDLDWICIERKTKGKHRNKACWSSSTGYKARSIGDWLFRLKDFGFGTSEFEQACIELGWEKEVEEYHNSKEKVEWDDNPVDKEDKNIYFTISKEE